MRTKTFDRDLLPGYRIVCQTARDETVDSECPHVSEVSAVVFDSMSDPVGFFQGQILHLSDSLDPGGDLFLECDNHSQGLCDLYAFLLMEDKPLHEATLGTQGDLFHLERLWIDPKNRGKRLGLTSCAALLALFKMSCGFAAMKPFPLQWEGRVDENRSLFQQHRQKLLSYYKPLNFIGVPGIEGFLYRQLDSREVLGFDRKGWSNAKRINLPAVPPTLERWTF